MFGSRLSQILAACLLVASTLQPGQAIANGSGGVATNCWLESGSIAIAGSYVYPTSLGTVLICPLSLGTSDTGAGWVIDNIEASFYDNHASEGITFYYKKVDKDTLTSDILCDYYANTWSTSWQSFDYFFPAATCDIEGVDPENWIYYVEVHFGPSVSSNIQRLGSYGVGES